MMLRRLRAFAWRVSGLLRRGSLEKELSDELESHLQFHIEDNVRAGMTAEEARRQALVTLGGLESTKEAYRERRGLPFLETLLQDIRYTSTLALRSPAFTLVCVLTLALGIGSAAAVFTVVNALLLRQPPYIDPDRLVVLSERFPKIGDASLGVAQAEYLDYRDRSRAFTAIAGTDDIVFDLTGGAEPVRIRGVRATYTLFSTLGVSPVIGRTFSPDEDHPGSPQVAVLSYDLWQRQFAGRADVLGRHLRLNEQPYTVIGVMPAGFRYPLSPSDVNEPPGVWVPMAFTEREIEDRAAEFPVRLVARLAPGVTLEQAQADLARVANEFQHEHPEIYTGNLRLEVTVNRLGSANRARVGPALFAIGGAVLFVLLIACANVGNLLLARGAARRRELAMRSALGASTRRLVRQLLTESLLLTGAAAILGCGLAIALLRLSATWWPWHITGAVEARPDPLVLAFAIILSIATGLLCGLAPAMSLSTRSNAVASLKSAARDAAAPPGRRVRSLLVGVEAASAVVLLIGAALLLRSFVMLLRVPAGFSPDGVLIARTTFNRQRYPDDARRRETERSVQARLSALPGVSSVGVTTHIPLADERQIGFILEGEDVHSARWADNALVTGSYFDAMGIPRLRGRTFGPEDTPEAPLAAILNESMARRFWPAGDALGRRLLWGGRTLNVVGIVGDVHIGSLESTVNPTIYTSVYQTTSGATTNAVFVVRTTLPDPASLSAAVRNAIWSIDPGVPVFDVRTMQSVVARSLGARRFTLLLLTTFAGLAVTLALAGVYSVLSYAVTQRTPELAVRLALGASPSEVLRLVLAEGLRMTAAGVAVGVAVGGLVARALSRLLFEVRPLDVPSFAAAASLMLLVALVASGIPARRAARVDPLVALRCE
jgi:predicted permease